MSRNYLSLFVFVFFVSQISFSQQMPIDFSSSSHAFIAFDGSGFSTRPNPDDAGDTVAQFFNDGSSPWQGFYLDLASPINLDVEQNITLDFYAFDPNNHEIMIKLENGSNPDVQVVVSDSGSGWQNNISFNFANAFLSEDGTPINATGTYTRLVIFIDGGNKTPGTYLIDDINDDSMPVDPNTIDIEYNDLVWADEFNTLGKTAINNTNWFHQTQLPAGGNWFNGEEQHYTNRIENAFVENGNLNIVAIKESFSDQGETKQYTSARLNSKFAFTYGRVDVRAKLPFGDGTWPAIWTLGKNVNEDGAYWDNEGFGTTNWPACGEIDVMEHGLGAVNHTSSALHTPSSFGNTVNVASQEISDVANNYHIYSVNWSPNQITFLVDDVPFYTYNPDPKDSNTWPFDLDQYLLLNVAMGGISGAIDPSFTQSAMVIDYVRVYQNSTLSNKTFDTGVFRVYPNPASDIINIASSENVDVLELFNILGKRVSQVFNTKQLNLKGFKSGIYILKISSNNRSVTKKIVIK